jgi:hypothetical protein
MGLRRVLEATVCLTQPLARGFAFPLDPGETQTGFCPGGSG